MPVPTREATHEAWSLMAALAASTSRVRLGQMCTCVSYRNPAYLAKVASVILSQSYDSSLGTKHLLPEVGKGMRSGLGINDKHVRILLDLRVDLGANQPAS